MGTEIPWEAGKTGFSVYPNPVSNVVYLQSGAPILQVEILGLNGRVLHRYDYDHDQTKVTVPAHHLQAGIYVIKATTSQGVEIFKIVKR
jgi:hypothetical protein